MVKYSDKDTFVVFDGLRLSTSRIVESLQAPKYQKRRGEASSSDQRVFSFDNFFQTADSLEAELEALAQISDRLDEKRLLRRLVRLSRDTAPKSAKAQEALGWIYQVCRFCRIVFNRTELIIFLG
jgi:hypothetical protein